jgi:hypothetical protein
LHYNKNVEVIEKIIEKVRMYMASKNLAYRIIDKDKCAIIGRGACEDKNIVIPDEIDGKIVVSIDTNAFIRDKDLISIKIANTIVRIDTCAFYDCKNLKYLLIPEEVFVVGSHAFAMCSKLEHIVFGRKGQLAWFDQDIFYGSERIKLIEISKH